MIFLLMAFFFILFFYGQHSFFLLWKNKSKFYFLFLNNFLPIKINEKKFLYLVFIQIFLILLGSIIFLNTFSLLSFCLFSPLFSLSIVLISVLHIKQKQNQFLQDIDLDFPYFLNLLSNILNAGTDIHQSMQNIQNLLQPSPLKQLLVEYSHFMESVPSPHQALHLLKQKFPTQNVSEFCKIILQCLEHGNSMSSSIQKLAKDVQNKHYIFAEKQIQKVPVKMMAPLMLCIFPVTFIVIFVPVILSLL